MTSIRKVPAHRPSISRWALAVAALSLAGVVACQDTKIVEVERPFFPAPPALAGGFLGYDEIEGKLTVCGNCHIDPQGEWSGSDHADAWATLQASGSAQEFCENCHSVGPNGNPTSGSVGYAATGDPRYHDVQCESCHGPGQSHVSNPGQSQPLASIAVGNLGGAALITLAQQGALGCAECHQGTHHPFVEEWAQSGHANVQASPAGRAGCDVCHRGQSILAAWGVEGPYVEQNAAEHQPITCAVCHDPHNGQYEGQLRFPVDTRSIEEHLCARCHNRRTIPAAGSHGLAPHAPEAALLLGDAGHFFPGTIVDQTLIIGTHGSDANPTLCARCHVNSFEISDPTTGGFVFNSTGHLFEAIPCLDAQGIPVPGGNCAVTADARSFKGCTGGACHGSESVAAGILTVASAEIKHLAEQLLAMLEIVDPGLGDAGGPIDGANPEFTVAEGAFFNYNLAHFGENDFRGGAAHNPFLIRALLLTSIQEVQRVYGVAPPASLNPASELRELLIELPRR